nr:hypothetical protein [Streptomonospora sp. PA3]
MHEEDPRQLGPFRLSDRVGSSAEGVVYLARDSRGRRVSVAMLSAGAAADPAARDRFAAAVRGGRGVEDPPPVLASSLSSPAASWVAVRRRGSRGAEAYLEPVAAADPHSAGAGRGPSYAPYWAGQAAGAAPAAAAWSWASVGLRRGHGAPGAAGWPVIVALLIALLLFAVLVVALFLLLQNFTMQAGAPPSPPPSGHGSSPGPGSGSPSPQPSGESEGPQAPATGRPSPAPSPSAVPSVDVDEDDYPPGEIPTDPQDQA